MIRWVRSLRSWTSKKKAGIVPAFKSSATGGSRAFGATAPDQKLHPIVIPSTRGRSGTWASMNWAEEVKVLA